MAAVEGSAPAAAVGVADSALGQLAASLAVPAAAPAATVAQVTATSPAPEAAVATAPAAPVAVTSAAAALAEALQVPLPIGVPATAAAPSVDVAAATSSTAPSALTLAIAQPTTLHSLVAGAPASQIDAATAAVVAADAAAAAALAMPSALAIAPMEQINWQAGTVKMWIEEKVFGFIIPDGGGEDVMVHKNVLPPGVQLVPGMKVLFESAWEPLKGKFKANRCMLAPAAGNGALAVAAAAAPTAGFDAAALAAPTDDNLFIAGLPLESTEESLKAIFGQYGNVVSCKILQQSDRADRAALVRMGDPLQAAWFVNNLHQNIPVGLATPIIVRYAQQKDRFGTFGRVAGKGLPDARSAPYGAPGAGVAALPAATAGSPAGLETGTVKAWIEERGMGFISPLNGGDDLFVHRSCLADGQSLVVGSLITYEPGWDSSKGKPMAKVCYGGVPQHGAISAASAAAAAVTSQVALADTSAQLLAQQQQPVATTGLTAAAVASASPDGQVLGIVKSWIEERGMGFVTPQAGGDDFFVHRSDLVGTQRLERGGTVIFMPMWDNQKQKPIGKAVQPTGAVGQSPAAVAAPAAALPTTQTSSSMKTGQVKVWFEDKGFGFITISDGSGDAFVHKNDLADGYTLRVGSQVWFECQWNEQKQKNTALRVVGAVNGAAGAQAAAGAFGAPVAGLPLPDVVQSEDSLFVKGLPLELSDEMVKAIFAQYGAVNSVKVLNPDGRPDKAAFVRMAEPVMAKWICDNLNNNIPAGLATPVTVRFATNRPPGAGGGAPPGLAAQVPAAAGAATAPAGQIPGIVKAWIEDRGMGFITPSAGGDDHFVHRTFLLDGQSLTLGSTVSFEPGWDQTKGKRVAKNVLGAVPAPAGSPHGSMRQQPAPVALSSGAAAAAAAAAALGFAQPSAQLSAHAALAASLPS